MSRALLWPIHGINSAYIHWPAHEVFVPELSRLVDVAQSFASGSYSAITRPDPGTTRYCGSICYGSGRK